VRVEAHDRKRLEQLCRTITRPALSEEEARSLWLSRWIAALGGSLPRFVKDNQAPEFISPIALVATLIIALTLG
ncbi:MAG: hypothetical protein ACK5XM_01555, partial [Betaproteobacteria bacterium]